jgi:hypothetical protein
MTAFWNESNRAAEKNTFNKVIFWCSNLECGQIVQQGNALCGRRALTVIVCTFIDIIDLIVVVVIVVASIVSGQWIWTVVQILRLRAPLRQAIARRAGSVQHRADRLRKMNAETKEIEWASMD